MRGLWRRFVRRQAFGNERLAVFIVASWTFHLSLVLMLVLAALEVYVNWGAP